MSSRPTFTRYKGKWWLTDADHGYKRQLTDEEFVHAMGDGLEAWGLSLRVVGAISLQCLAAKQTSSPCSVLPKNTATKSNPTDTRAGSISSRKARTSR